MGFSPHIVKCNGSPSTRLKKKTKPKEHSSLTEGKTKISKQQLVQTFNYQISKDPQLKLFSGTHILLSVLYVFEKVCFLSLVMQTNLSQTLCFCSSILYSTVLKIH